MEEQNALFTTKFEARDQLVQHARRYYASKGYALSIKDSRKDKYVVLGCDRGGVYRNRRNIPIDARKKASSSRLINCPFEVRGKRSNEGLWVLELKNNTHNHDPSECMSGHPSSRCLTQEEIRDVEKMSMAGIEPRQILTSLREKNPNLQAVSRTIYNMKAKLEKQNLGGRTLVQALFEEFEKGDFTFDYLKDKSGHLTHVFFAHTKSITLARTYTTTFVMDCTYKTNKYGMPLLDIIGISSFNKSFYAGFAFLRNEKTEDYIWALQVFARVLGPNSHPSVIVTDRQLALIDAIGVVFPRTTHLLCVWHIQKNVVANLKGYFKDEEDWDVFISMWNAIIYAETEEAFEESWLFLQLLYREKKEAITYIEKTWIPEKKKFVSAWTENHMHFGNRASSRVEGAHAKLKKYLQVSNGNLHRVKNKICLAIENEFHEIKTLLESEKIRVRHKCNIPYFKDLIYKVSTFALKKLHKQYEMSSLGTLKVMSCLKLLRNNGTTLWAYDE
ncbi:protein FAR-RED IMPAIRED RESPONSE 1-like [Silene latifolia]|uniref:protein FAR-RED IMPAIRED RESPONSE 1-like n=1 Tax=Silene latifolia TaxID=37657 RepID=UPI003D774080